MEPHLKALLLKVKPEFGERPVLLGDEVERRPEPEALLKLHELQAFVLAFGSLHIMGQDQGKFLALGPAGPALGRFAGPLVDRPDVGILGPLPEDDAAAELDLETSRN